MGPVLPTAITLLLPVVLAVGMTILARRRLGPVWAVGIGTLTLPVLMAALAVWALGQPNPEHHDGAAMIAGLVVMSEPVTMLIGLVASLLTVLVQSKLRSSDSRSAADPSR
jgi:formate hydrogenlyase subunit 3/multisubunit Na+/H+ antiporter MnhD subunit